MYSSAAFIHFDDLSISQRCDSIVVRMYTSIQAIIKRINTQIFEDLDNLEVEHSLFGRSFIKLYDAINHLMRLEEHVLFQYIKTSEQTQQTLILRTNSVEQHKKHQYQLQELMLLVRTEYLVLLGTKSYNSIETIIDQDLFQLDFQLKQWIFWVTNSILKQ